MSQPEAIRLSRALLASKWEPTQQEKIEAAAELRRLHEVNQMLVEALKEIESLPGISSANLYARKALAKAKEKNA